MIERLKEYGINPRSKAFKRYEKANLLEKIDFDFLDEIKIYWNNHYKKDIVPINHIAYMNLIGEKDVRIMPNSQMWNEIIPFFNDMTIRPGYSDKNLYDKLIDTKERPDTILKCVHGNYFDEANNDLNINEAKKLLLSMKQDLIIKTSNTDNGQGINKLYYKQGNIYLNNKPSDIGMIEQFMGKNFIVQTIIKQHPMIAEPHPSSVNTLRMVTFRWQGEIRHLLTYARFGGGNNIKDHAIAGGVSVSVNDEGILGNYGLDTHLMVHSHHPTTNYSFQKTQIQIPNYEYFKEFVIRLHQNILHHDYVSWDIAVGYDGQPILIEPNFRGTTWRYQLASKKPIFGELTEDVLQHVSNELNQESGYMRSSDFIKKKRMNRRVRNLNSKNKIQREEISILKKQLQEKDAFIEELQSKKDQQSNGILSRFINKINS